MIYTIPPSSLWLSSSPSTFLFLIHPHTKTAFALFLDMPYSLSPASNSFNSDLFFSCHSQHPSKHPNLCHLHFISCISSTVHVSKQNNVAGLTAHQYIIPFTEALIFVPHISPKHFLLFLEPECILPFNYLSNYPSLGKNNQNTRTLQFFLTQV